MKEVLKTDAVCVVDNLLSEADFKSVWDGLQKVQFSPPVVNGGWHKVWRLTHGSPVWGPAQSDTGGCLGPVWDAFQKLIKKYPEYVAAGSVMTVNPYIYPPGTKLAWHNDAGYKGAITFYAHPKWGATWGGELMVANCKTKRNCSLTIDHEEENKYLMEEGNGIYIACKPNRAVMQMPGTWHGMSRIDTDAGENVRVSVQAFFR